MSVVLFQLTHKHNRRLRLLRLFPRKCPRLHFHRCPGWSYWMRVGVYVRRCIPHLFSKSDEYVLRLLIEMRRLKMCSEVKMCAVWRRHQIRWSAILGPRNKVAFQILTQRAFSTRAEKVSFDCHHSITSETLLIFVTKWNLWFMSLEKYLVENCYPINFNTKRRVCIITVTNDV